jgi:hypothetical protein
MGIADFFRPKHRHSDVRVRIEAVRAMTTAEDAATLIQIARTDREAAVRRIAIEKIDKADVLAEIAAAEADERVRELAGARAAKLWLSAACGEDAEPAGAALSGIVKIGDQHALVEVAARGGNPAIRKRAFGELRDPKVLAELAKRDAPADLRIAAVGRIDDGDVLRGLAIDTTSKEVGLAAVEKLDDVERLEQVAQKAKNKAVRQKARKIVTEIQEAEAAKRPAVPDEVKRKRAERAQLLREVENAADSHDFAAAAEIVKRAEAAWAALGEDEGGDDRFGKHVERFWRRKELHDSQARSGAELRAIGREAAAARAREAAERAAARGAAPAEGGAAAEAARDDEPDDYVRPIMGAAPDPKREAREAEARARREEREKQRAEEEARRQAAAAERAAKAKEDAERGAAIAASLGAMCDDMEQLAGTEQKTTREIDRVLAQAAKAFENLGKAPAAERDKLAERYRVARGKLVTRAGELREAEDWQRWTNVPKAEALIDTAKQLLEAPATPDLGNRLRALQALWKEVGPMPQRRSKELWEQFKATCDGIYDKVKGVRAVEQEKFADVAKAKEALIAEAEALAESTDWAGTAEKLKQLQAQWKQSGHLPRKQGDELWNRFRAACDRFFARRKPLLDAQHEEQAANLQKKHTLIARAQAIAAAAPGEGGWGKAIGAIKDLQQEWKQIGFVPRRDADAVYRAFRAACDALFAKRDAARDTEANAHRAELDGIRAELEAVTAGPAGEPAEPAELVARAVAVRAKAAEHGAFAAEVDAMVRAVLAAHPDAVKGTELDPAQARARREKLIARAEELLPKQPAAPAAGDRPADIASQLKQAMRQNAFGELRFSGRDPVEVIDELRASWAEAGPILDDADRAQAERFEGVIERVLAEAGPRAGAARDGAAGGRRRRERHGAQQPLGAAEATAGEAPAADPSASAPEPMAPLAVAAVAAAVPALPEVTVVPDASASALAEIATSDELSGPTTVPVSAHDAITQPAHLPPEPAIGVALPPVVVEPLPPPPARAKPTTASPPMEELDTGWDLGDEDPTAGPAEAEPAGELAGDDAPPSAGELAGDGAVEGDGLDQVD